MTVSRRVARCLMAALFAGVVLGGAVAPIDVASADTGWNGT